MFLHGIFHFFCETFHESHIQPQKFQDMCFSDTALLLFFSLCEDLINEFNLHRPQYLKGLLIYGRGHEKQIMTFTVKLKLYALRVGTRCVANGYGQVICFLRCYKSLASYFRLKGMGE